MEEGGQVQEGGQVEEGRQVEEGGQAEEVDQAENLVLFSVIFITELKINLKSKILTILIYMTKITLTLGS